MSAFVVYDDTINDLVTWAALTDRYSGSRSGASYSYNESARIGIKGNEQRVAAILYTANVESVNERYSDDDVSVGFAFQPYAKWRDLTPVAVLKLCDCFDYQAGEVPMYRNTIAAQIVDGIRSHAIGMLPGYDAAPWGL